MDDYLTKKEVDCLYKQDYEYFKKIEMVVKENDYQKIWEVKKEFYPE